MLTSGSTAIDFTGADAAGWPAALVTAGDAVTADGCRFVNHALPAATDARIPAPASAQITRLGFSCLEGCADANVPLTTDGSSSERTTSFAVLGRLPGSFSSRRMMCCA